MAEVIQRQVNRVVSLLPQRLLNVFPPGKILRFLTVGGTGGLVGLGVLYGLTDLVGLHYLVSGIGSWLTTLGVVYIGNSRWTFGYFPGARGFGRFLASNLVTAVIGFSLYALFTGVVGIWYMASSVLSTGCVTLINWLSSRYWIWRR